MNIQQITPFVNLFGFISVIAAGILYWRRGASKASVEVLDLYEKNIAALKEQMARMAQEHKEQLIIYEKKHHDLRNELQTLTLQLGNLQGQLTEKDKKIDDYIKVFQGRSPEQEQYMADMRAFTAGVAKYMKDSAEIFAGMKTFMSGLNEKADSNERFNTEVAAATKKEQGKPLRKAFEGSTE